MPPTPTRTRARARTRTGMGRVKVTRHYQNLNGRTCNRHRLSNLRRIAPIRMPRRLIRPTRIMFILLRTPLTTMHARIRLRRSIASHRPRLRRRCARPMSRARRTIWMTRTVATIRMPPNRCNSQVSTSNHSTIPAKVSPSHRRRPITRHSTSNRPADRTCARMRVHSRHRRISITRIHTHTLTHISRPLASIIATSKCPSMSTLPPSGRRDWPMPRMRRSHRRRRRRRRRRQRRELGHSTRNNWIGYSPKRNNTN